MCLLPEAATGGVLWEKVFLKTSQDSQENTCATLLKKRLAHLVNFGISNFYFPNFPWNVSYKIVLVLFINNILYKDISSSSYQVKETIGQLSLISKSRLCCVLKTRVSSFNQVYFWLVTMRDLVETKTIKIGPPPQDVIILIAFRLVV